MTQVSGHHSDMKGGQPWIESDLLKLLPETQSHKFKENLFTARIITLESGEHLLDDGQHSISAIFGPSSNGDSFDGDFHQHMNHLYNGMAINVLEYSYNIIRAKDGTFQFYICVGKWEHTTNNMEGCTEHLTNVNSLETVKSHLQNCVMNTMRNLDSESQSILNQLNSDSQNLSALVKLANYTITSQSQQMCSPLDMSSHLNRPAHSETMSDASILPDVSTNSRSTTDTRGANPSVAPVILTSKEVLPGSAKTSDCIFFPESLNKSEYIWQPKQALQLSHKSNIKDSTEHSSLMVSCTTEQQQNKKRCIESEVEKRISPSYLLDIMAKKTQKSDGQKCNQERSNCSGTLEKTEPLVARKSTLCLNGKLFELGTPAYEDLLVPSDQRKSLAIIQEWCLCDDPSQDSSPSSRDNKHGSHLLQSAIKDKKKNTKTPLKIVPIYEHSLHGLNKDSNIKNHGENFNTKLLGLNCDGQNIVEHETIKNSSASLFSDTDHDNDSSSLAGNLDNCLSVSEGAQQKTSLFSRCPESNGSDTMLQKEKISESNKGNILKNSCDRMIIGCDNMTNGQCQFGDTAMDTVDFLITEAVTLKCGPRIETPGMLQGKCVDSQTEESCGLSTKAGRRKSREIGQISSSDGNREFDKLINSGDAPDNETGLASSRILETTAKQQNARQDSNGAIMSSIIDLSSSDDIYMIAGHDIDSFCENLVSSTDSEVTTPFHPCHMSTQTGPDVAACIDSQFVDQRTNDKEVIHGNNLNKQDCTTSLSCTKSCNNIASPDITTITASDVQGHTSTSTSQDISRMNSVHWQSGDRSRKSTDSGRSLLCHCPLCTSTSTNVVLKAVLTNVATAIKKDTNKKRTIDVLGVQGSQLEKIPGTGETVEKCQEGHLSQLKIISKGKHLSPKSCRATSVSAGASLSATNCFPSPFLESSAMEVRVIVTDIMNQIKASDLSNDKYDLSNIISRKSAHRYFTDRHALESLLKEGTLLLTDVTHAPKKSELSDGENDLSNIISDGSDHSSLTKRNNKHLTSSYRNGKVQEQKKQHWTRSCKYNSYGKLQKLNYPSLIHMPKRHFSIFITEVGQHDPNILKIKRLSEQPIGCRVGRQSAQKRYQSSSFGDNNVVPRKQFTMIKKKYACNLKKAQDVEHQIYQGTEKDEGMKANSISAGKHATSSSTSMTSCQKMEEPEVSTEISDASLPNVLSLFSLTASTDVSDWRNVTPVLDSSPELEIPKNHKSFSGQCELPASLTSLAALDSQGFVPSKCSDERRDDFVESSTGFEPQFTGASITFGNSDSLCAPARLDKSIASLVNYVCHGKLL